MPAVKLSKTIKHATQGEARVARKLLNAAFKAGYVVSIHDGGEWVLKQSRFLDACCTCLCSTGDDCLTFRDAKTKEKVGTAWLIWGNDEDGSELIADHSDNDAMNALVAQAA